MVTANPFEAIDSRLSVIESLLSQLTTQPANDNVKVKDIGGIELAVEETGLSKSSIYRMAHERSIPHFKNGGRLYFSRKELRQWITKDKRGARKEDY